MGIRKQKDIAVIVSYTSRRQRACICPDCPEAYHYECYLTTLRNGRSYRQYYCTDWGLRKITRDSLVVLKDTGHRSGRKVVWEVQE